MYTLDASSPLYWAAAHGMREVVEMILHGGVDLQAELHMSPGVLDLGDLDESIRTIILSYVDDAMV